MPRPRKLTAAQTLLAHGVRSGLEAEVAEQLKGIGYLYEEVSVPFVQPVKPRRYTPDFIPPNGIVVETKGQFQTADRQKHLMVKAQYPDLDLRFVFSRSATRISKQSKTTYALWCRTNGFPFADVSVPQHWINEAANLESQDTILNLLRALKDPEKLARVARLFGKRNLT